LLRSPSYQTQLSVLDTQSDQRGAQALCTPPLAWPSMSSPQAALDALHGALLQPSCSAACSALRSLSHFPHRAALRPGAFQESCWMKSAFLLLGLCAAAAAAPAAQPLSSRFNADPSPHYFQTAHGGGYYLYATDDASNSGTYWDSTSWRLYTSPDLQQWKDAGVPLDVRVFGWARPDAKAWAPDAVARNGKYYFYAPIGGDRIGVAVADDPAGPFRDARSDALVDKARDANAGAEPIDPQVLVDDDGQAYLVFGTRVPKVVRLAADMIHLAGPIQDVVVTGFPKDDPKKKYGEAPFLHKHAGRYYFSFSTGWPGQIVYATSTSPTGPFQYRGVILDYLAISTNHQAIIEQDGTSYLFYHDALLPGGGDHRRSIIIAPLTYQANGDIVEVKR
jgi:beta-xylosidase